uniref:Transcription factor AP-2 C-terminal domain-containing protein n=1 Tax=Panagrolaimus sp. JU765 TaxID=591449 RepID=A0AC34QP25_9BILA
MLSLGPNIPINNDAIAELISKRKRRLEASRQVKAEPIDNDENCPKKSKSDSGRESCSSVTTDEGFSSTSEFVPSVSEADPQIDSVDSSPPSLTCESDPHSSLVNKDENPPKLSPNLAVLNLFSDGPPKQPVIRPNDVFGTVTGRLSLLNVRKYNVTVGEISRRIHGPEGFSFSLLGGLLRKAKMPNNTNILKNELEAVGLGVERGRRRGHLSLFSSLLEEETINFAKDFTTIMANNFPYRAIADKVVKSRPNPVTVSELETTKKLVKEFISVLRKDSSPIIDQNPTPCLEPEIQEPLSQFSMLTHGFGNPAVQAVMMMFEAFIDAQISKVGCM